MVVLHTTFTNVPAFNAPHRCSGLWQCIAYTTTSPSAWFHVQYPQTPQYLCEAVFRCLPHAWRSYDVPNSFTGRKFAKKLMVLLVGEGVWVWWGGTCAGLSETLFNMFLRYIAGIKFHTCLFMATFSEDYTEDGSNPISWQVKVWALTCVTITTKSWIQSWRVEIILKRYNRESLQSFFYQKSAKFNYSLLHNILLCLSVYYDITNAFNYYASLYINNVLFIKYVF